MCVFIHFIVSFAVNQRYSYVPFIGKEALEDAIQDQIPSFIPAIQSEDIKDVSIYKADGGKVTLHIFPLYRLIIPRYFLYLVSYASNFYISFSKILDIYEKVFLSFFFV